MERKQYRFYEKKILIYAAGGLGQIAFEQLISDKRCEIVGFIDKRSDVIKSIKKLPVMSIEDIELISNKNEYLIFITVRNVFEHSLIAKELFDKGFHNIIFQPYKYLVGKEDSILGGLAAAHNDVLIQKKTPSRELYECLKDDFCAMDDFAAFEEGKVFLPAEMLFTNNLDGIRYSNLNFIAEFPAVKMYKALLNSSEDLENVIEEYIDIVVMPPENCEINTDGEWRKIARQTRVDVCNEMRKTASLNFDFFKKNCTTVIYNNKKFNLCASGKNRVAFLIASGYKYIPVKISDEDYYKYLNISMIQTIESFIQEKNIKEIFAPIPHPFFYRYPFGYKAENYVECWLGSISRFLSEQFYNQKKEFSFTEYQIDDYLRDTGVTSRFFKMLGAKVNRVDVSEFTCLFDELFYYQKQDFVYNGDSNVLMCSYEVSEITLSKISNHNYQYIFYYGKNEDKQNLEVILNRMSYEKISLFSTIWNMEYVSGCVYIAGK